MSQISETPVKYKIALAFWEAYDSMREVYPDFKRLRGVEQEVAIDTIIEVGTAMNEALCGEPGSGVPE